MEMLITDCVDKLVAAQTIGTRQERIDKAIKTMLDSGVISQLQADALAGLYYEDDCLNWVVLFYLDHTDGLWAIYHPQPGRGEDRQK